MDGASRKAAYIFEHRFEFLLVEENVVFGGSSMVNVIEIKGCDFKFGIWIFVISKNLPHPISLLLLRGFATVGFALLLWIVIPAACKSS